MKSFIRISIYFGILTLFTTQALAQKTAFVNETQLLAATTGYEKALQEMDSIKTIYTQELQTSQTQFEDKVNTLLAPYNFSEQTTAAELEDQLSPTDLKKWELLKEEQTLLQKKAQISNEEYQAFYQLKVGTILTRVNQTIENYCKSKKIQVLYKLDQTQQELAYMDEELDVTEALIKLVKEK